MLWSDPPPSVIQAIYQEARGSMWKSNIWGQDHFDISSRQGYLRRVSVRFDALLAHYGILVEDARNTRRIGHL